MSWTWICQTAGDPVNLPDSVQTPASFGDQASAEQWLSDVWPDLADAGVDAVTLMANDTVVYGPMSLHSD